MELIRGLHNLKKQSGCILTIGNFDGVHLGHQEILKKLVSKSKKMGLPSLVVSFSVTPETFFGRPKARLSSFRDKHLFLESMGVDKHLLIRFNKGFSELSASSFINQILVQKIGAKYCFIGDDFRFGKGRLGDFSMLKAASHENNYTIEKLNSVLLDGLSELAALRYEAFLPMETLLGLKNFLAGPFQLVARLRMEISWEGQSDFPLQT
jgi:riboflavin kinase/FMN adenylyltransferase